jgi:hypothetical protein
VSGVNALDGVLEGHGRPVALSVNDIHGTVRARRQVPSTTVARVDEDPAHGLRARLAPLPGRAPRAGRVSDGAARRTVEPGARIE